MKASKIKIKIKKRLYRNIGIILLLLFAFYICYKTYQTQNRKFREGLTKDEQKNISNQKKQCDKNCKSNIKSCTKDCGHDKDCKADCKGDDAKDCSQECSDNCADSCPVDKDECDDPADCDKGDKACKKAASDCRKNSSKCQDLCGSGGPGGDVGD